MLGLLILFVIAYVIIASIGTGVIVLAILRPRRKSFGFALAHGLPTEPSDLDFDSQEVTFNLPGQHTTPGWIIAGEKTNGPTVLVLHGHGDFTCGAMRFVKTLAPFASNIVLFDWPGHGRCSAPWMTCGLREPGDAIAVLDGLPDEIRKKPIVLFGYSLGGQIAIKTAGLYADRFAGTIADGAYRRWDTPIRMKLKRHRVPTFPFIQLTGVFFGLTGMIRAFDRAAFAKKFDGPTLYIHGTDDRICPIQEGQELADASPNSTFVAIQGGRHNQLHEQEPEQYREALEKFFHRLV